ncbi:hypothetical protein CHLNCDRAFT_17567, partial [Chlorella variabilis]
QSLDFINIMTYDFHGAWDQAVNFHTPWKDPLVCGVCMCLCPCAGMCPRLRCAVVVFAINLGIGAYGRSWTLADRTKSTLGSAAWSPGSAGACTGEAGYMSWQEIKQLIAQGAKGAMAAYMVSGSTWVAFDLPQTIYMKILAARKRGLGGLMV